MSLSAELQALQHDTNQEDSWRPQPGRRNVHSAHWQCRFYPNWHSLNIYKPFKSMSTILWTSLKWIYLSMMTATSDPSGETDAPKTARLLSCASSSFVRSFFKNSEFSAGQGGVNLWLQTHGPDIQWFLNCTKLLQWHWKKKTKNVNFVDKLTKISVVSNTSNCSPVL
jgi:hypothetical protein